MKSDFNEKFITISAYFLICVFFFLMILGIFLNIGDVFGFFSFLFGVIKPVIYGLIIALIVMPLVRFYETKALKFIFPKKPRSKLRGALSVVFAYLSVLLIIATLLLVVVPQLIESYNFLQLRLSYYLSSALKWLDENLPYADFFAEQYNKLTEYIRTSVVDSFTSIQKQLPVIFSAFNRVISEMWSIVIGIIVSVYLITSRRMLIGIIRKTMTALFKKSIRDRIYIITGRLYRNFIDYTTGRLLYTLIITAIFFVVMWILQLPFYSVVACIIGIAGLIPVAGTLAGAFVSAFIVFITAPNMTVWFILIMLTVHILGFIYIQPRIIKARVRRPVGITLIAVIIMGALFGIVGLLMAVPIYVTVEETVKSKIDVMLYKRSIQNADEGEP
ncbi:MAG: AI-2E family transporter [Clostridiales bacterium]|nr:AI-2E family transporter [Clostridiales bacterium]